MNSKPSLGGSAKANLQYRPAIDGLRAVAVLAVIAYHAGLSGFSGGYIGVDVFFVISGFLITRLLADEASQATRPGEISLSHFYSRRFRRLLPAAVLVWIFCALAAAIWAAGLLPIKPFVRSLQWSLPGFANLFFLKNSGGYFDAPTHEMPLLHLWSLGVEEQFYLLWPLLLSLTWKRIRWVVLGISAVSLAFSVAWVAQGRTSAAFFLTPFRAWELGVGCILALRPDLKIPKAWTSEIGALSWVAILAPIFFYGETTPFPGVAAIPPVLGTAGLILLDRSDARNLALRLLNHPVAIRVGLLSYGAYLWHWPLLVFLRLGTADQNPGILAKMIAIAMSLGFADLSLRFFESRFRKGKTGASRSSNRSDVAFGALTLAALAVASLSLTWIHARVLRILVPEKWVNAIEERSPLGRDCFDVGPIGTDRCRFFFPAESTLWIAGDSHAQSYFSMLADFAKKNHAGALLFSKGNTLPFFTEDAPDGSFHRKALDEIRARKKSSGILVARWLAYQERGAVAPRSRELADAQLKSPREWDRRLLTSIQTLKKAGTERILILLPYPEIATSPLSCLRLKPTECSDSRKRIEKNSAELIAALKRVSEKNPGMIRVFDPLPSLCTADRCDLIHLEDFPILSDTNHPSFAAVRSLRKSLEKELKWLKFSQ